MRLLAGAVFDDPRRFLAREKSRDGAAVTQYRSGANQTLAVESRACTMRVHRHLAYLEWIRTLSVSKSRWFVGRLPCQRRQFVLLGQPSGQHAAACIPDRVLCVPFGRAFICCQCDALDILQTARHASSGWDKRLLVPVLLTQLGAPSLEYVSWAAKLAGDGLAVRWADVLCFGVWTVLGITALVASRHQWLRYRG